MFIKAYAEGGAGSKGSSTVRASSEILTRMLNSKGRVKQKAGIDTALDSTTKVGDVVSVKNAFGGTDSYVKIGDNTFAAVKNGKLYSMTGYHNMYSIDSQEGIMTIRDYARSRGYRSSVTTNRSVYTKEDLSRMKLEAQGIRGYKNRKP